MENDESDVRRVIGTQVFEAWRAVFAERQVRADSDFFALGGDSMMAVAVASEIEARTGIALPLRMLFENATVERLSGAIADSMASLERADLRPIPRA